MGKLWVFLLLGLKVCLFQLYNISSCSLLLEIILSSLGIQEDSLVPVITEMNTLDAVFIRQAYRRQGWGCAMLHDIIKQFPDENIGFSHPISLSLQHGMTFHNSISPLLIRFNVHPYRSIHLIQFHAFFQFCLPLCKLFLWVINFLWPRIVS